MSAFSFGAASLFKNFKLSQEVVPHINAKWPLVAVVGNTLREIHEVADSMTMTMTIFRKQSFFSSY